MTLQSDIIKYLSQPTAYSFKPDSVTVLETNMSYIFLTDKWVYKIKKEIVTQNADFSTPEKRKQACLQEMRRSAIYAPYLITALKPVHRLKNGRIKIGGKSGEEIDSVLVMKRIPDSALLKYILSEGVFGEAESAQLGKAIATLHLRAKSYHHFGTVAFLEKLIQSTEKTLLQYPTLFPAEKVKNIISYTVDLLHKNAKLISLRIKAGYVRKCHGNLLLSNIAHEKKRFLFFSPIEYNEQLECVDVLYDLSVLLVHLAAYKYFSFANIVLNQYLSVTNDIEGVTLLPLFQLIRALREASLRAIQTTNSTKADSSFKTESAKRFFTVAENLAVTNAPVLVLAAGENFFKKRHLLHKIAPCFSPAPGAVLLEEALLRKNILGLYPYRVKKSVSSPFEKIIYEIFRQQTRQLLSNKISVIINAGFQSPQERLQVEQLAKKMKVSVKGILFSPANTDNTSKNFCMPPAWEKLILEDDETKTLKNLKEILKNTCN